MLNFAKLRSSGTHDNVMTMCFINQIAGVIIYHVDTPLQRLITLGPAHFLQRAMGVCLALVSRLRHYR